ncbi:unnamed protein product [Sphagnum jensenii]|uniref:Uncharacterized protein n=2 Tax=Sphagnum jensenii TaxID=128206 RepID=A0ABP1AC01_9BRYO
MAPDSTGTCLLIQNKILEDFGNQPRGDGTSDVAIMQYRAALETNLNLPDAASPAGSFPHTLGIANQEYTEESTEPVGTDRNPLLTDAGHRILDPELAVSDVRPDLQMGLTDRNIVSPAMAHKVQGLNSTSVCVSLADHSGSVPVPPDNSFSADAYLALHASTSSSPGFEVRLRDQDIMPAGVADDSHGVDPVEVPLADLSGSVSVPPTDNEHKGEREKGMVGWENGGAIPPPGLG